MDFINNISGASLVLISIIISLIITFLWIFFWLRQDNKPEPKKLIFLTFFFGGTSALILAPIHVLFFGIFSYISILTIIFYAASEEIIKFFSTKISSLRHPENNERIDPSIYLITGSLGFSFVENILYFIQYFNRFEDLEILTNIANRAIGATLLHGTTSAIIGICLATVFFRKEIYKKVASYFGIFLAISFHSFFNFLVLKKEEIYLAFTINFIVLAFILLIFTFIRRDERIRENYRIKERI